MPAWWLCMSAAGTWLAASDLDPASSTNMARQLIDQDAWTSTMHNKIASDAQVWRHAWLFRTACS